MIVLDVPYAYLSVRLLIVLRKDFFLYFFSSFFYIFLLIFYFDFRMVPKKIPHVIKRGNKAPPVTAIHALSPSQ